MIPEKKGNPPEVSLMTRTTYSRLEGQLSILRMKYDESLHSVGETAGSSCDWHDNFGYDQACRDAQTYFRQVKELEKKLHTAEFIRPRTETQQVGIGNTVIVQFLDEERPEIFTILGPDDSDPDRGWISSKSPVGQAILTKGTGEEIKLKMGEKDKILVIKILEILPGEF